MLDAARYQWEEGRRRLDAVRPDPARYRDLSELVDVVADELRRRVGQTFTLSDLAHAYTGAEDWVREVVAGTADPTFRAGVRDVALIQDAAFFQYARGATDYEP